MLIVADGKNIDTLPFQNLFVQGEKLSEQIIFRIARHYYERDLLNCVFIIKAVNEKNEISEQVLKVINRESHIDLKWNVSSLFTAVSGKLNLEIQALDSTFGDEKYVLKYILPPVYVRKAVTGDNVPAPDLKEQAIEEINTAVSDGLNNIDNKIQSFDTSGFENRLDNLANSVQGLEEGIKIMALTLDEYNLIIHHDDILYVII